MIHDNLGLMSILNSRPILKQEELMWIDAGFYIEPSGSIIDTQGRPPESWRLFDNDGNSCVLLSKVGHNLRKRVIQKWQQQTLAVPDITEEEVNDIVSRQERSQS